MKHLILALLGAASLVAPVGAADHQAPASFSKTLCQDIAMNYLLYFPPGYDDDASRRWPLILFLHGSGERGNELDRVAINGLPKELAAGRVLPAIVISPQCPADREWTDDLMVAGLNALLDEAEASFRVDPDRISVTGLSMGGRGTWALAASLPERFAAIAPVCGGGDPDDAVRLRRLPIRAFHGAKDDVVPIAEMLAMDEALKRAHGDMQLTVYPEANHDSWTATYSDPGLYRWLLAQKRESVTRVHPAGVRLTASTGDASKAFDGDHATRWESEWSDPQWLQIDLGAAVPLHRMTIHWETAHASVYELLVSSTAADGDWRSAAAITDGDGTIDVIDFPPGFEARRLRLDMTSRGTRWGYSIWEIELE